MLIWGVLIFHNHFNHPESYESFKVISNSFVLCLNLLCEKGSEMDKVQ